MEICLHLFGVSWCLFGAMRIVSIDFICKFSNVEKFIIV